MIGNSFSIPIVHFILAPIQPFFAQREYTNYPYQFAWERPGVDLDPPEVSERVEELIVDTQYRHEKAIEEELFGTKAAATPAEATAVVTEQQQTDGEFFDV